VIKHDPVHCLQFPGGGSPGKDEVRFQEQGRREKKRGKQNPAKKYDRVQWGFHGGFSSPTWRHGPAGKADPERPRQGMDDLFTS